MGELEPRDRGSGSGGIASGEDGAEIPLEEREKVARCFLWDEPGREFGFDDEALLDALLLNTEVKGRIEKACLEALDDPEPSPMRSGLDARLDDCDGGWLPPSAP